MSNDAPERLPARLTDASDRFLKWAYKEPYSGPPVISIPAHPDNVDLILVEASRALTTAQARIAELEAALRKRDQHGHDELCAAGLLRAGECTCGHAEAVRALEAKP